MMDDELLGSYGFDWVNDLNAAQEADTYTFGSDTQPQETTPEQTFENSFYYKPDVAVQGGSNWWEQNVYENPWNQNQNLNYQNLLGGNKNTSGMGFYMPSEASTEFDYNPYSYIPQRYNQTPSSSFSGLEQLFYDQVTPVADSWWALNTPTGTRYLSNLAGTGGNDEVEKNPYLDQDISGYGYVPIDYAKQLTGQDLSEAVLMPEGYNPRLSYQYHQPGSEDVDIGKMLATMAVGGALGYFAGPLLSSLFTAPAAGAAGGMSLAPSILGAGGMSVPAASGTLASWAAGGLGAGAGAVGGGGLGNIGLNPAALDAVAGAEILTPELEAVLNFQKALDASSLAGIGGAWAGATGGFFQLPDKFKGALATGNSTIDNLALNASKAGLQELVGSTIQGRDVNPTNILTGGVIPSLPNVLPSTGNQFFDQILQGGVTGGLKSGIQGGDILQGALAGAGAPVAGAAGNLVANAIPDTGVGFLDRIINDSLRGGTSSGLQSLFSGLGGDQAFSNMLLGSLSSGLSGAGQELVPRIEEFLSRNVGGDPLQSLQTAESLGITNPNMPLPATQSEEEQMFENNDFTFNPDYSLSGGGNQDSGFGLKPTDNGFGLNLPANNNFLTPTFDQPFVSPQDTGQGGGVLKDLFKNFTTPQNIGTLISGIMSRNQAKDAASAMARNASSLQAAADPFASQRGIYQDQLRKATLDPLAIWNSPEYQGLQSLFREELERKDAAAGRRSQYGPRSERLQKHFLDYLMNYRNQMGGFAGSQFNPADAARLASGSYSDEIRARSQASGAIPGALGSIFEQIENARTRKLVEDYLAKLTANQGQ